MVQLIYNAKLMHTHSRFWFNWSISLQLMPKRKILGTVMTTGWAKKLHCFPALIT